MRDSKITIRDLKGAVRDLRLYRGWDGERAVQRMVMATAIELGELTEHFRPGTIHSFLSSNGQKYPDRRRPIMKRCIILLLALVLAIFPAAAEQSFSPYDYVTGSAGGGRFLYYDFPDISLYLPASWEGRFTVETDEFGVAFYQTASYDKYLDEEGLEGGGFLFRLSASEDESFRDLLAYEYLGYSENAGLHFYLTLPPEYTAYPEDDIMADYEDMAGDMETIIEMVQIAPNMSFYPGDSVPLDGNDLA